MAGNLPESLWVEREQFSFDIKIEYENPSYFCFTCNCTGHSSDHCRKDTTKNDPPKRIKQVFVPKKHEDIVQGCTKNVAIENPLTLDIIRFKEALANVLVRDGLNIVEEFSSAFGGALPLEHVGEVHTVDLTDISLVQNPPPWCGMSSANVIPSDEVLNPNVDHDLAIVNQYWEYMDAREQGVYTDEEREAAIKFLKSRAATNEEPFTVVVSNKAKKKKICRRVSRFITPDLGGRHPD
jgi:hypothetical protein